MGFRDRFRRSKPALRDYLYVDERRLDRYLEQFSSTSTYDKVASVGVGLSGSGPSAHAEQARHPRRKSTHEKIEELIGYLERNGHLRRHRPGGFDEDDLVRPDFAIEECEAVKVLIPRADGAADAESGVVVWISEWPDDRPEHPWRRPGVLCIIQDGSLDDRRRYASFSSYSWILALLHQLHIQPVQTALAARYPFWQTEEYTFDLMIAQSQLERDRAVFRPHPLRWLGDNGCVLSARRRITALYWIRHAAGDEIGTQNRQEDFTTSTFAYGIAIWAGAPARSAP